MIRLRRNSTLENGDMDSEEDNNSPMMNSAGTRRIWKRRYIIALQIIWFIAIVWSEILTPTVHTFICPSPLSQRFPRSNVYKIIIVSDPQLTDFYSYDQPKNSLALSITEFYSDLYMKRNFHSLMNQRGDETEAVVILGDLFDGGRVIDSNQTFDAHVSRFSQIFNNAASGHNVTVLNMSGNHDVGLGRWYNAKASARFRKIFNKTNYVYNVGPVDLVMIDSVGILSPGTDIQADAIKFIDSLEKTSSNRPRILFTHIPLYRPEDEYCGPRRHKKSPRFGGGVSYQNLLPQKVSEHILRVISPVQVFSGDDHSSCEYRHHPQGVPEYTLAAYSWLQGERRPEYVRLEIKESEAAAELMFEYTVCDLPLQLDIYIGYGILGMISIVVAAYHYFHGGGQHHTQKPYDIIRSTSDEIDGAKVSMYPRDNNDGKTMTRNLEGFYRCIMFPLGLYTVVVIICSL